MSNLKLFCKALKYKVQDIKAKRYSPSNWHKSLLIYPFRLFIHPLDTFNDLKYEKKASLWIANGMAVLFLIVRVIQEIYTSYLFSASATEEKGAMTILLTSVGVLVIWTVCNWATCTLFDGEGTVKDIWIVVTYSLLPYLICSLLNTVLSHYFTTAEVQFYTFFSILGTGWTLMLIFLGLLVAHQYTVTKNILSILGTLLIIVCLIFLLLLFLSIFQQIYDFMANVISEVVIRNL